MHNADNEVTQADRDAYEALMHDEHYDDLDTGWEHFALHRISSVEAACRDRDAEIEQARDDAATFCIQSLASMLGNPDYAQADGSEEWEGDVSGTLYNVLAAAGVLSEDDHSFVTLTERDQLRAKLDEAEKVLRPFARAAKWWKAFHDFQRITALHQHGDCLEVHHLRDAETFLASAPQPLVSKEQAIKLAEMEGDAEIGAGMPDHPLRTPEQKAQGDGAEPDAWQYRYRPVGTEAWSDWSDGKAPEMRGGSYETEDRPLYAHPPAPVEAGALREALAPFAKEAASWWEKLPDEARPWIAEPGNIGGNDAEFTVGDLRRLYRIYAGLSRPASEEG